jgi:diguanylate cyclase (GGDEF)-like protein
LRTVDTGTVSVNWPRRDASSSRSVTTPDRSGIDLERVVSLMCRHSALDLWLITQPEARTVGALRGQPEVPPDVLEWAEQVCDGALVGPRVVAVPDVSVVPGLQELALSHDFVIGAFIGIPLVDQAGVVLGSLCGISPVPIGSDLSGEVDLAEGLATLVASVVSLEQRYLSARQMADAAVEQGHRDALTGVLNRAGWDSAIEKIGERCRSHGEAASVIIVDLDGLKSMNDEFGHAYGDEQIRAMASAIRDAARYSDVVARLGGDEFGVLIPGSSPGTADAMARRLQEEAKSSRLAASIGSAECPPGGDLLEAWRRADMDMYATKRIAHGQSASKPPARDPSDTMTDSGPEENVADIVAAVRTLATAPLRLLRQATRAPQ